MLRILSAWRAGRCWRCEAAAEGAADGAADGAVAWADAHRHGARLGECAWSTAVLVPAVRAPDSGTAGAVLRGAGGTVVGFVEGTPA